ncbi:MAG: hypothetical protein V1924_04465 [Candidatus Bathyarchaeota archaeon]
MGLSTLSIWVRDPYSPLLPYQSSGHSFRACILTADYKPLHFGAVQLDLGVIWFRAFLH